MKSTTLIGILGLTLLNHSCGEQPLPSAKSNATIKVLDERGNPIEGVVVGGTYFDKITNKEGFGSGVNKSKTAVTNTEGIVTLTDETRSPLVFFGIRKAEGYYQHHPHEHEYKSQSGGIWQPDNPLIEFKLKPIKNPIPLHAKRAKLTIPKEQEWIGFDFEKADWVAPYGNGIVTDVSFHLASRFDSYYDQESTFQIRFPHPMDGAVNLDIEPLQKGSTLKMPYMAPEEGYATIPDKTLFVDPINPEHKTNVSHRNYYFLRIRSVVDENNKLIKANYVKVHNDFRYVVDGKTIKRFLINYYFNPTANDRNLEFDMKKNLFKNLPSEEVPLSP